MIEAVVPEDKRKPIAEPEPSSNPVVQLIRKVTRRQTAGIKVAGEDDVLVRFGKWREIIAQDGLGLPRAGRWRELVNTDSELYGGSGVGNLGAVTAEAKSWNDQPFSAELTLPPLGVVWLVPEA